MNTEKQTNTFKVSSVALDTTNIDVKVPRTAWMNPQFDTLITSISANNEYLLCEAIRELTDIHDQITPQLNVVIDFLDGIVDLIPEYLESLCGQFHTKWPMIDCLLLDGRAINFDEKSKIQGILLELFELGIISSVGFIYPKSIDQLIIFKEIIEDPKLPVNLGVFNKVGFEVCPLKFNLEMINWCEINKVDILGFNPMGGNIASANLINAFTAPYLLSFAANYCSTVVLSGRNLDVVPDSINYLVELLDTTPSPKLTLRKSVDKLPKKLPKVINTSVTVDKSCLPYDSPLLLYNPGDLNFNFVNKPTTTSLPTVNAIETDEISNTLQSYLDLLKFPEDGDDDVAFAIMRIKLLQTIKSLLQEYLGWRYEYVRLGDRIVGINLTWKDPKPSFLTRILPWKEIKTLSRSFILALPNKETRLFFPIATK